jgi:hypothetical protein
MYKDNEYYSICEFVTGVDTSKHEKEILSTRITDGFTYEVNAMGTVIKNFTPCFIENYNVIGKDSQHNEQNSRWKTIFTSNRNLILLHFSPCSFT